MKNQGLKYSANENDIWVWMRPQIGFCTIGKFDLFLLRRSLPLVLNSSSSFFHEAFHALVLADEVSPIFLFGSLLLFFHFSLF
jgi:hypothetical protein